MTTSIMTFTSTQYTSIPSHLAHLPVLGPASNKYGYVSRWNFIQENFDFNGFYRTQDGPLYPCKKNDDGRITNIYEGMSGFELLTEDAPKKQFYSKEEISIYKQPVFDLCLAATEDNGNMILLYGVGGIMPNEDPTIDGRVFNYGENEFAYYKPLAN